MTTSPSKLTILVSGHTDLSKDLFDEYYRPRISDAANIGHAFVLGCADGVDRMSFDMLYNEYHLGADRLELFNKEKKPDFVPDDINCDISSKSWTARDDLMTSKSNATIAYVRPTKMALGSGTARNIVARVAPMDVHDFFGVTRSEGTTIKDILVKYPVLKMFVMGPIDEYGDIVW